MKIKVSALFLVLGLFATEASAGGWGSFLQGFAEGQQRNECERTYSAAMCSQMERDKEERLRQQRQNQQLQYQLEENQRRIQQLEREQQYYQQR
jgi:hypothetical protein